MDEGAKPFACSSQGCQMAFSNEDHLHWHQKKHDMMLNLGAANKNAEPADQTPTPTRFIRNCEEVGLFQDLQNVNPFDETFKKAVGGLHVPNSHNDENSSLHTPHVFPPEPQPPKKPPEKPTPMDLAANNLRNKLKEALQNKVNSRSPIIRVKPPEKIMPKKKRRPVSPPRKKNGTVNDRANIREVNRAAQLRCRKRKKVEMKKTEEEIKTLKATNVKLRFENQTFRETIYRLKEVLVEKKEDDRTSLHDRVEEILKVLPLEIMVVPVGDKIAPITIQASVIQPKPVVLQGFQLLGTLQKVDVCVLPNDP